MGSFFLKLYGSRDKKISHTLKNNGPKLFFMSICSIQIRSRRSDIVEKTRASQSCYYLLIERDFFVKHSFDKFVSFDPEV